MNDVRPLAFLFIRSFVNGVKRAITSPKRIIALAAVCFYYYTMLLRPFSSSSRSGVPSGTIPKIDMPGMEAIDAAVFGAVGLLSLLLMMSVLSYKGGFKAADVDVLFPTPISPRLVLLFRIIRDSLVSLFLPLIIALISYRPVNALKEIFKNMPNGSGNVIQSFTIAYLLVSVVWVTVGYAASLFVNRSDLQSDRNRKIISGGLGLVVITVLGYIALQLRASLELNTLLAVAQAPLIRILLAPVTLATWTVMGTLQGNYGFAALGFAGLVGIIGLALRVAMSQVGWMYDQAAARGVDATANLRNFQRQGDMIGMQAERARQGKLKSGRIATRIARLSTPGGPALLWKEAILQARGSMSSMIFVGVIYLGVTGLLMWTITNGTSSRRTEDVSGWFLVGLQAMMVYVVAMMGAQTGFMELLRRVDLQKPLPFTPSATVFWETSAKAVVPSILGFLSSIISLGFAPKAWQFAIAGTLITPSFALLISAVVLAVIVLFPDIEDPSQRMFRGLMLLIGIAIAVLPGIGLFGGLAGPLHLSPILVAIPTLLINLGITVGLCAIGGHFYAGFNPNE